MESLMRRSRQLCQTDSIQLDGRALSTTPTTRSLPSPSPMAENNYMSGRMKGRFITDSKFTYKSSNF